MNNICKSALSEGSGTVAGMNGSMDGGGTVSSLITTIT